MGNPKYFGISEIDKCAKNTGFHFNLFFVAKNGQKENEGWTSLNVLRTSYDHSFIRVVLSLRGS
jgi:hypothetical protein